jgi:triphosphoribosyl-dephospho-CoA synthetase
MNPANLQLEGLIMACAAVNRLLVEKGLLTAQEVETALKRAEARITSDDRFHDEDIRLANRDAMCFPIRMLLLANGDEDCAAAGFSELARQVGLTKQPFNDQR